MIDTGQTETLYTKRSFIYDFISHAVRQGPALKRFFSVHPYLASGMRVLDAGCGSGVVTKALLEVAREQQLTDVRFYGFDLTPAMLEKFSAFLAGADVTNVELRRADVLEVPAALPPDWRDFDLVVCSGMLEHVPADQFVQALANVRSLVKREGRIVVFISRKNLFNRLFIAGVWKAHLYTKKQLIASFEHAGFIHPRVTPFRLWGFVVEAGNN